MAVDKDTGCQIGIDFVHYKIHRGEMYLASTYTTVTSASLSEIYFKTGPIDMHVVAEVNVSGAAKISFYEAVTTTADGSSITVYNLYRNSAKSCGAVFFGGPTWSTKSEKLIFVDYIPGGDTVQTRVGGTGRTNSEFILKPNTKHILQIQNLAGTTITASVNAEFYELDV